MTGPWQSAEQARASRSLLSLLGEGTRSVKPQSCPPAVEQWKPFNSFPGDYHCRGAQALMLA